MMMLPILPLGLFRCLACALLDLILGYYQGRLQVVQGVDYSNTGILSWNILGAMGGT